jgi:hypothetical protein
MSPDVVVRRWRRCDVVVAVIMVIVEQAKENVVEKEVVWRRQAMENVVEKEVVWRRRAVDWQTEDTVNYRSGPVPGRG